MRKGKWGCVLALAWLVGGCCSNPGVFQKVRSSLETVQNYYGQLFNEGWDQNDKVKRAVVAADTTLMVAGEMQKLWCPDTQKTEQLELQAQEAKKLAQEAGVAKDEGSQETVPGNTEK